MTPNVLRLSAPYAGQTVSVVQAVIVLRLLSKGAMTPNPSVSATCASPASDVLTIWTYRREAATGGNKGMAVSV